MKKFATSFTIDHHEVIDFTNMKIDLEAKKSEILDTIKNLASPTVIENVGESYDKYFKGFGGNAEVNKVYGFIFDVLYDNKLVFADDWKWEAETILWRVNQFIPTFDYSTSISEIDEEEYKISGSLTVNGKQYELTDIGQYDFFPLVNRILKDLNINKRILIVEGFTGDTLFYSIIDSNYYDELSHSAYLPDVLADE